MVQSKSRLEAIFMLLLKKYAEQRCTLCGEVAVERVQYKRATFVEHYLICGHRLCQQWVEGVAKRLDDFSRSEIGELSFSALNDDICGEEAGQSA